MGRSPSPKRGANLDAAAVADSEFHSNTSHGSTSTCHSASDPVLAEPTAYPAARRTIVRARTT